MIRDAVPQDLPEIVSIYNEAVRLKFRTGDMQPVSVSERQAWFHSHSPDRFPLRVYAPADQVLGWYTLSAYRPGREALRFTVELSTYVTLTRTRSGIGTALMRDALETSRRLGFKSVFGIVLSPNEASIALLNKFQFQAWGRLPGVADFDDQECDHLYFGLRL